MKKISLLTSLVCLSVQVTLAQKPCDEYSGYPHENLAFSAQLIGDGLGGYSGPAGMIDGDIVTPYTHGGQENRNNVLTLDLTAIKEVYGIEIYHPGSPLPNTSEQGLYIFFSKTPFQSIDINSTISNSDVEYFHLSDVIPSGERINLSIEARYIRIQTQGIGEDIIISEIVIVGGGGSDEICGNGIDDDCDGNIDCDDADCGVTILNANVETPSCTVCGDGVIAVNAYSANGILTMSTNGSSFINCNGACTLTDLDNGVYDVVISNGVCQTQRFFTIAAPVGGDESNCPNGGFEYGDFSNWTGSKGQYVAGDLENFSDVPDLISNEGYALLRSGEFADVLLTGTSALIESPTGGTYIARLGNPSDLTGGGNDAYKLTNCFEVTADNAEFAFNYAVVISNPNHEADEQPFFEWRIYSPSTGQRLDGSGRIRAGTDFFDVSRASLSVQGWTCQTSDLSAFIGQEVCVEFLVTECGSVERNVWGSIVRPNGTHGGYAYIDAMCQIRTDNAPNCDFEIESESVCGNQSVNILFNAPANNFTRYAINICDSDGNNCTNNPLQNGFMLNQVDVLGIATQAGIVLEDNNIYMLELVLENDCGKCSQKQKFIFYDVDMYLDFPECLVVCGIPNTVIIPGISDCINCTYEWTPSQPLSNPTVLNPIIDMTLNADAFNTAYTVTATKQLDNGGYCVNNSTVKVSNTPFVFSYDGQADCCNLDAAFTITSKECPILPEDFVFAFVDELSGASYSVIGTSIDDYSILFQEIVGASPTSDRKLFAEFEFLGNSEMITTETPCMFREELEVLVYSPFVNHWRLFFPNAFTPNGDGLNDDFHPLFNSISLGPSGQECVTEELQSLNQVFVFYVNFTVWNRYGEPIHIAEISLDCGAIEGIKESDLAWDGFVGANIASPGAYLWTIEIRGCPNALYCPLEFACANEDSVAPCLWNEPGVSVYEAKGFVNVVW